MEQKNRVPYNQHYDYRFIRYVRHLRNKTLKEFAEIMGIDYSVLSRLENGQIKFTPIYEERFKEAMKRLRVSGVELHSIGRMLEMKEKRGYK
jgi:transcriptional regulator with XRE-family HTH domain